MPSLPSASRRDVRAPAPSATDTDDEVKSDDKRMPFFDHLSELRIRLRNSVIGLLLATAIAFPMRELLYALLARPLRIAWSEVPKDVGLPPPELVFTHPAEAFMVEFKLSLLAAIFIASPIIFHQLWRFIAPGLYQRERRYALVFIGASVVLFVGGAAFAYTYVLPASYKYFLGYTNHSMGTFRHFLGQGDIKVTEAFTIRPMITMDEYFGLTSMLLLVFGIVFELPLALAILAIIGIVSPAGLWRFNRYAILIFFVAGAVLTPGDLVVGQIAMGLSLTVLYNLSIVVALLVGRKRRAARAVEERAEAEAALVERP